MKALNWQNKEAIYINIQDLKVLESEGFRNMLLWFIIGITIWTIIIWIIYR